MTFESTISRSRSTSASSSSLRSQTNMFILTWPSVSSSYVWQDVTRMERFLSTDFHPSYTMSVGTSFVDCRDLVQLGEAAG